MLNITRRELLPKKILSPSTGSIINRLCFTTGPGVFLSEALELEFRIDSINFSMGVDSWFSGPKALSEACKKSKMKESMSSELPVMSNGNTHWS